MNMNMNDYVWSSRNDSCEFAHHYSGNQTTVDMKIKFSNSAAIFNIHGQRCNDANSVNQFVLITISNVQMDPLVAAIPYSYVIEYDLHSGIIARDRTPMQKVTETQVVCTPWYIDPQGDCYEKYLVTLTLKLTAIDMVGPNGTSFFPLVTHLKSYVERGPDFILIGADGKVTVPRRILKLRSDALDAMFNHDFEEKQTNQIELLDFDTKTLTAFKNFLMTGKITDGKETALGLILLGDKYNIIGMKLAAEHFVKENIVDMDMDDVFNVFSKVCRESLYHAIVSKWIKEWKNK